MTDPAAAARAVAGECARAYHVAFPDRLVAAYLLGSLAYGGYAPAVSDIDLALVLADSQDGDPGIIELTSKALRGRGGIYRKLSVFWGSLPGLRGGRFPALDRLELIERGVRLLGGDVAGQAARPTADELVLESARFALDVLATDEVISEFRHPRRLLEDPVLFSKGVLFPVRFLYTNTKTAGRAATNTEAITWYLSQPQPIAAPLVRLAARVRAGHSLDPEQIAPELAAGLLPLYRHYLDDQTRRLHHVHAPLDLITAFAFWHERLT